MPLTLPTTDDSILEDVLRRERGFVNHPADRGGPTNWGITQATLTTVLGRPASVVEVHALTREDAKAIYREHYVIRPGLVNVADAPLRALLVDCAVNHGPVVAVRWLQRALGVMDDGIMGPVTRAALEHLNARRVYLSVCAARIRFYGRIITNDPKQAVFAAGWANRVAEFVEQLA